MLRVSRYGSGVAAPPPLFSSVRLFTLFLCSFDTAIDVRALKLHSRQLDSSRLSSNCAEEEMYDSKIKAYFSQGMGEKKKVHCIR